MLLYIALLVGFLLSFFLPQFELRQVNGYQQLLYLLLAIGLYGAVHEIDLEEFHKHKSLILRAITIGVFLKSLLIGGILWVIFQTPYAFLFGIIVAQIDPLSVAHLITTKSSKFSQSGRTILRAWSSFDDPMTVLLALYVYLPLAVGASMFVSPQNYLTQLVVNLLFAGALFVLKSKFQGKQKIELVLLGLAFLIAIVFQLMLSIALIGLFLRPRLSLLPSLVHLSFVIAAVLLGMLITLTQTSIFYGIVLGISGFVVQIVVTPLVAPKLLFVDKLFLAFSQYNGITAIILALIISSVVPQTVSVVAIAVVTINTLYYASNWLLEKRLN